MITGIAKIKSLGVYENYTKPTGMQEFGSKNLIYGWNYSGKTTLSRLFAQLESKSQNPDLANCSFTFETSDDAITESNFTETNLIVRVFNSDFVRDNLNFAGQSFKPILLLGKESGDAQKKLDHCEDLSKRTQEKIKVVSKAVSDLELSYAAAKTVAASKIKKNLGLVEAYTATHLNGDIGVLLILEESQLLAEDKLRDDLKLALTPDSERPGAVDRVELVPSIDFLHKEAEVVLAATPSLVSTIKHFEDNPLVEKWVGAGLPLHSKKDECEFCGGNLTEHRLAELQAHFSRDLADHKGKIERLHNLVSEARVSIQLPKEVELNPQFREKFREVSVPLLKVVEIFNQSVDALVQDLQRKIDAPFRSVVITPLPEGLTQTFSDAVTKINVVIDGSNQIASDFTKEKREAIKRVKLHYVQEFVDEQRNAGGEKKLDRFRVNQRRLNRFFEVTQQEANRLRAVISQAQLGREDINQRLVSMMGGDAVQIKVVAEEGREQFRLVRRDGSFAKNLSDGEKTAVAFSYFLTKLKELKPEQFKEAIVYIDDPISSLDANHIFQITATIRDIFFHQEKEGDPWVTNCKQFFVSTHNFEFFHLLREVKPDGPKQARLFLIRRVANKTSTIGDMPNSLAKYSSEYHFLFEVIHQFHIAPDKTNHEVLMLLPNAVRRFVELYTYSRLPGVFKESVDQRAELLFGKERSKRILKVFHYFSHANSIDRLAGNNELIFDVEHAVNDLLSAIQANDSLHWNALVQAVSK